MKFKINGINLIGLIIASALGSFIIAVIIKVTINVSNNFQIVRGMIELEQSTRIIDNLFIKFFSANGFGNDNPSSKINTFYINSSNDTINFSLWYAGSSDVTDSGILNDAISCSGRQLGANTTPQELTIFIKNRDLSSGVNGTLGYLSCFNKDNGLAATDRQNPEQKMPIIRSSQIVKFYAASIVQDPLNKNNLKIIPIIFNNAQAQTDPPVIYNSFGIKLALVLRTTLPVFNFNKTTNFSNILGLGVPEFTFNQSDKYLYKLVTIEYPFINNISLDDNKISKTQILKF